MNKKVRYSVIKPLMMSGGRDGVHHRIRKKNNVILFMSCDKHTLNLVGVQAAKKFTMIIKLLLVLLVLSFNIRKSQLRFCREV